MQPPPPLITPDYPSASTSQRAIANIPAAVTATNGMQPTSILHQAHGTMQSHQQKYQEFRSSIWTMVGLVVYILSPLDLIPDIVPVLGWLDDALVFMYLLYCMWQLAQQQMRQNLRL